VHCRIGLSRRLRNNSNQYEGLFQHLHHTTLQSISLVSGQYTYILYYLNHLRTTTNIFTVNLDIAQKNGYHAEYDSVKNSNQWKSPFWCLSLPQRAPLAAYSSIVAKLNCIYEIQI